MSIVRVGLAETRKFAEGYDAIFGAKKAVEATEEAPAKAAGAKKSAAKPKAAAKKASARKKTTMKK